MSLDDAHILIVDDERDLAENLREILEDEGALVSVAHSASAALQRLDGTFDVALLDMRLPDASGLELIRRLREAHEGPFETLLITGNASLEDAIAAVEAGAYAYVLKPFDPPSLIANVDRALTKVRLEREAHNLALALKRREANLRTLVDTVQALLVVMTPSGTVIHANPAAAGAVGLSRRELEGQSWVDEFVVAQDRDAVRDAIARTLRGERVAHEHGVYAPGSPQCPPRRVQWSWASVTMETGERRIYASGLDVTDLRAYEHRARIAEKLAAVGTLSAGLAHEIRNPLNAAALQLQLLSRRAGKLDGAERLLPIVRTVQEEIGRLSHLVDDFLLFARPTHLRLTEVDLCALAGRMVALEAPAAAQVGVTLQADVPTFPVTIEGDGEKLSQVLLNLMRNGVEAVAEHEGHVQVGVRPHPEGAVVEVRDDGRGIPPDLSSRIFEPFYSTKEQGTGLGMAICHSLITLHGGEITVRNDGGAVFRIFLPHAPPTRPPAVA